MFYYQHLKYSIGSAVKITQIINKVDYIKLNKCYCPQVIVYIPTCFYLYIRCVYYQTVMLLKVLLKLKCTSHILPYNLQTCYFEIVTPITVMNLRCTIESEQSAYTFLY